MNIRPDRFVTLVEDVRLLKQQIAAVLDMMANQRRERDPSIRGFCKRHNLSRGTYANLRKAGKGPREVAAGVRRIISEQAETDWIKAREIEATEIASKRRLIQKIAQAP
jgi:hypothetical protein